MNHIKVEDSITILNIMYSRTYDYRDFYKKLYYMYQNDKMLNENPLKLFECQVETLCSVFNPEIIGVYSDKIDNTYQLLLKHIPIHHHPKIIYVQDFDEVIEKGLYQIGLKNLKGRREK